MRGRRGPTDRRSGTATARPAVRGTPLCRAPHETGPAPALPVQSSGRPLQTGDLSPPSEASRATESTESLSTSQPPPRSARRPFLPGRQVKLKQASLAERCRDAVAGLSEPACRSTTPFVLAKQAACLGVLSAGQLLPGSRTVTGLFQL